MTFRRKAIYEELHPETKLGASGVSRQVGDTRERRGLRIELRHCIQSGPTPTNSAHYRLAKFVPLSRRPVRHERYVAKTANQATTELNVREPRYSCRYLDTFVRKDAEEIKSM